MQYYRDHFYTTSINNAQWEPDAGRVPTVTVEETRPTSPDEGSETCVGNPVQVATGNKLLEEVDFATPGLALTRTYSAFWGGSGLFGPKWLSGFDYRLTFIGVAPYPQIIVERPDGFTYTYDWNASESRWDDSKPESIAYIVQSGSAYAHHTENHTVEIYDASGRVTSIEDIRGIGLAFNYDSSNQLIAVAHDSGRSIGFTWSSGRVSTATAPDGRLYTYSYAGGDLLSVSYPDTLGTRSYAYYSGSLLASYSINDVPQSSYNYYTNNQASESGQFGGRKRDVFAYGADFTDVTNATGHTTRYEFAQIQGRPQLSRVVRNASANCPGGNSTIVYDANGYPSSETDFNGNRTEFAYNMRGQLLERRDGIVGVDTNNQYRITYQWDAERNLMLRESHYGSSGWIQQEVEYAYHPDSAIQALRRLPQLVRVCDGPCSGGQTRTTTYAYTFHPNNLPSQIQIARPTNGTTTTNFDSSGRMTSTINTLGHTTSFNYFGQGGAMGWPTAIIDANGLTTEFDHDAKGRITQRRVLAPEGTRSWSFEYTPLDGISRVSDSGGRVVDFVYDSLGYLITTLADTPDGDAPESIDIVNYEYNALGQRTRQEIQQAWLDGQTYVSETRHTRNWSYDAAGYLASATGNDGQNLRWQYDPSGNVASFIDSLNGVTTYVYDSQHRLVQTTDPANGVTQFSYDALGRLAQVTDPQGKTTAYGYNGFGELLSVTSPDTGTTSFTYDTAGRRLTMLASNGRSETYSHDALGRVTAINASSPQLGTYLVSYNFDNCWYGKGRLCSVNSPGGSVEYLYSRAGQIYTQASTIEGKTYWIDFYYDHFGRLGLTKYESETGSVHQVRCSYNNAHQINRIEVRIDGQSWQDVATDIRYEPYGGLASLSHGGSLLRTLERDQDGRLTRISSAGGSTGLQDLRYSYNANDLITLRANYAYSGQDQSYGYDALARLTSVGLNHPQTLNYDASGNRTTHAWGGSVDTYDSSSASNQLDDVSTTGSATRGRTYTHDSAGNRLTETVAGQAILYSYNGLNQLAEREQPAMSVQLSHEQTVALPAGTWEYGYDGLGRRTFKRMQAQPGPTRVRYIYGPDGLLHAESRPGATGFGTVYIWLNGEPIAFVRDDELYHVHTDHLGRPEVVTSGAYHSVKWRAENFAWDRKVAHMSWDVSQYNLGLPGQYYDEEAGQWYNNFRTYDSSIGRYTQSDPIGLVGGINTYAYGLNSPTINIDSTGTAATEPGLGYRATARILHVGHAPFSFIAVRVMPVVGLGMLTFGVGTMINHQCDNCFGDLGLRAYDVYPGDAIDSNLAAPGNGPERSGDCL